MGEEKISLDSGILVGLSKKDSCHQIGIHIGESIEKYNPKEYTILNISY